MGYKSYLAAAIISDEPHNALVGYRDRRDDFSSRRIAGRVGWARQRCGNDRYATSSRRERGADGTPAEIMRVHFAEAADAEAFARQFGLQYPAR